VVGPGEGLIILCVILLIVGGFFRDKVVQWWKQQ
jgi:hypothetical protein